MSNFLEKDRFLSKDGFIHGLAEAIQLRMHVPDDNEPSVYDPTQDLYNLNIQFSELLHADKFVSCLQGYVNIGIDDTFRVRAHYKFLNCVYDSNHETLLIFPASVSTTSRIKWFLQNAIMIIGKQRYETWCKKFSEAKVKVGRKRKNLEGTSTNVEWLLNEDEEKQIMCMPQYMKTAFQDDCVEFVGKFVQGFVHKVVRENKEIQCDVIQLDEPTVPQLLETSHISDIPQSATANIMSDKDFLELFSDDDIDWDDLLNI